jgi:glycosyltransferase involved in cell wall biosynthesis
MGRAAVVSYRLGGIDGVSVEAAKWVWALRQLGHEVTTVAGAGQADALVAGLDAWPRETLDQPMLAQALAGQDLVVVENVCSLPLNRRASEALANLLRGRRAVLHHHDLPWQRPGWAGTVPDDEQWLHVTVNELSRRQLADRDIRAVRLYNCFDAEEEPGDRLATRAALGVAADEIVLLQPTRAIARKNLPAALEVASGAGATLWITGPTEEGYQPELDALLGKAQERVIHRPAPLGMAGAYAAADGVILPSWWEGFGNPAVEGSIHRRPVMVGPYPVADELRDLGFRWFSLSEPERFVPRLRVPQPAELDHNRRVAAQHLSLQDLPARLSALLGGGGA